MEKKKENRQVQYMTRRIGSTTYKVKVVFGESGETMEEKILRMIQNEGGAEGSGCGIIDVPQVSRPA